jgi:hypothetical protein
MKRTPIKKTGKIGRINREANRRLKVIYMKKGITCCEVNLPGCLFTWARSWHHRYPRQDYYDRDREKHIANLADFKSTLLVCNNCHKQLQQDKELSEQYFDRVMEDRKRRGI